MRTRALRGALAALAVGVTLGGCTTTSTVATGTSEEIQAEKVRQMRFALESRWARMARLQQLAAPLLQANVDLCGKRVVERIGVVQWSAELAPRGLEREVTRGMLGDSDRLIVLFATAGSPAANAGLRRGDVIVSADGAFMPTASSLRPFHKVEETFDAAFADGKAELSVLRGGEPLTMTVESVPMCDYPVELVADPAPNALADGRTIGITTGMMVFADTDLELQTVLAHELAHNTEGHIRKSVGNQVIGGIIAAGIAASTGVDVSRATSRLMDLAFSKSFEREADYVGLYMLERAGIDSTEAANIWRRMAAEFPDSIRFGTSHPTSAERFVNLAAASEEIRLKKARGEPLVPERKGED